MNIRLKITMLLIFILFINGCAAVGVPVTFNPEKKLWYAEALFDKNDRPLPAQNLIEEAIVINQDRNDEVGLADAYRMYAFFLQSPAVGRWSKMKFFDKTVTQGNRYEKALEYWNRAVSLYEKNYAYDRASNCYFNIEKLYFLYFDDKVKACSYNTKSLQSYLKFKQENPNVKVETDGFGSFEDFIKAARKELGCPD